MLDSVFKLDHILKNLGNSGINKNTDENLIIHINPFGSDFTSIGEFVYEEAGAKWLPNPSS